MTDLLHFMLLPLVHCMLQQKVSFLCRQDQPARIKLDALGERVG